MKKQELTKTLQTLSEINFNFGAGDNGKAFNLLLTELLKLSNIKQHTFQLILVNWSKEAYDYFMFKDVFKDYTTIWYQLGNEFYATTRIENYIKMTNPFILTIDIKDVDGNFFINFSLK